MNKVEILPEIIELTNHSSGEIKDFIFREFEPGDEIGIMECVKEEYNSSYFKRDFYSPKVIRDKALGDDYVFFVVECEDDIKGVEIFVLYSKGEDDYLEPASQIFKIDIRGFGVARELVRYTFKYARLMKPNAIFVHAVTFHGITQKVCEREGMVPVGFRFGRFLTEKMDNHYPTEGVIKHSEGVMIEPVVKKNAGRVYLPHELTDFCIDTYGRLGTICVIMTEESDVSKLPDECNDGDFSVLIDDIQRFGEIKINRFSKEIFSKLQELIESYKEENWVFQIIANINDKGFSHSYQSLKALGFFFSGIQPLCSDTEKIYMQYIGDLELRIEKYVLSAAFRKVANDLLPFIERKNQ